MIEEPMIPQQIETLSGQSADWPIQWKRAGLGIIAALSIALNFYQLGQTGYGNLYYAAGVRSMLDNWHNFFFVSFDPGGFVTIDKPPLGFWLQVVSTKIFGFTAFSIVLPQVLAGIVSVFLLYYLVRRHFGITAGMLAALALALSPISVVTNRNNTIDSTLALAMLIAVWTVMPAIETGKMRWLLYTGIIIGLGFNIKMLEAFLIVPALGLVYLLAAPHGIWKRIRHLAIAVAVMMAVSLSWAIAVDLTPANLRPYVGSSTSNSEIALAFGYNGITRLLGFNFHQSNAPRVAPPATNQTTSAATMTIPATSTATSSSDSSTSPSPTTGSLPTEGIPGQGRSGYFRNRASNAANAGSMFNTGTPGIFRLFNEPLGGQIAWILPIALFGLIALTWQHKLKFLGDVQQQSLVIWGMWLLTMGIFFSVANFFHQYYFTVMAPSIAAMFGIGIVTMWKDFQHTGWRGWLLPMALIVTALEQIHIITSNSSWGVWFIPLVIIPTCIGAAFLIVYKLYPTFNVPKEFLAPSLGLGIAAVMIVPAYWSLQGAISAATEIPSVGSNGFGGVTGSNSTNTALVHYLKTHQGNAKYLVATVASQTADSIIVSTNEPVMAMGGFSGSDTILTTSDLAAMVQSGTIRYFLINGNRAGNSAAKNSELNAIFQEFLNGELPTGFPGPGAAGGEFPNPSTLPSGGPGGGPGQFGNAQNTLSSWITQHCTMVPTSTYQSTTQSVFGVFGGTGQLYDCSPG